MSNQHTFQAFESYDFDSDPNFQAGLPAIHSLTISKSAKEANQILEKAKCFYYSKAVENIDYDSYILWKNSQTSSSPTKKNNLDGDNGRGKEKMKLAPIPTTNSSSSTKAKGTLTNAEDSMPSENKDQEGLDAETGTGSFSSDDTVKDTAKYPRSFQEICEMIANGTPIPGNNY
ncbi:7237_t:CDS:2 [Ambispora leptoticha]|uniref:7237_t:CDS:1 n=1 Tax=Ambispora leptoticha TaxID=144679 RepID=A0A9N9EYP6_9GLOM|nr:7237_t:CDS:2 [Ambispora leptoticha]